MKDNEIFSNPKPVYSAPRVQFTLDGTNYTLVDEIDNIPIVDSFVKKNKIGQGSGEARLYIGAQSKMNFCEFFENFNTETYSFFEKRDFELYLNDAQFEYEEQEQGYINDISSSWNTYTDELATFSTIEKFNLEDGASDTLRFYIRSQDDIFRNYFRSVLLPGISSVSILKLQDSNGINCFWFRPVLSYSFNPYYHPAKEKEVENAIATADISQTEKDQLIKARVGQGRYRQALLEESTQCVITGVNDERILRASHIKPWSVSTSFEKTDPNNGLILTPTYDLLFDQGFITFDENGDIEISPYISPLNIKKLLLQDGKNYSFPKTPTRLVYLKFHRENIFKA